VSFLWLGVAGTGVCGYLCTADLVEAPGGDRVETAAGRSCGGSSVGLWRGRGRRPSICCFGGTAAAAEHGAALLRSLDSERRRSRLVDWIGSVASG
jgi:hypothetical protein